MEDNYNVLGDFETLNSVNIVKKMLVPQKAPTPDDVAKGKDEFDSGLDDFLDIEQTINFGKRQKTKTNAQKSQNSKQEEDTIVAVEIHSGGTKLDEPIKIDEGVHGSEQCVACRTRSSLRRSIERDTQQSLASTSKQKGGKRKTANENTSNPNLSTNIGVNVSKNTQRGRKRKTNTASSTSEAIVDSVVVVDDQLADPCSTSQFRRPPNNEPRDVMRARRNYIAERAARCTNVDFVDLITSPLPRIEGVIDVSIDSDDETETNAKGDKVKPLENADASLSEDNPEISVKIIWNGKPEVFKLRKFQKFESIFEKLAERAKTEKNRVLLNLDNKIISPTDTPASIEYKSFQFIYGRAMVDLNLFDVAALHKKKRDPNILNLKIQSDKWKHPISLKLHKTEKFRNLIIKCSEELKMPCDKIKLSFDGEPIQLDQTSADLDFEGGEVLEIHLKD